MNASVYEHTNFLTLLCWWVGFFTIAAGIQMAGGRGTRGAAAPKQSNYTRRDPEWYGITLAKQTDHEAFAWLVG